MSITQQDVQFASFILAQSDKLHLLDPIIAHCEKAGITVWSHFEQGLIQQHGYTAADAQRKMQQWFAEFMATQAKPEPAPPVQPQPTPPKTIPEPFVEKRRSRAGLWWLLLLPVLGAGAWYWWNNQPGKGKKNTSLYVLTEDNLLIREGTDCDPKTNKPIYRLAYNQAVELAGPIDSSGHWVKVRVPDTLDAHGKPVEGYVAEYRFLGTMAWNASLDSIYPGWKRTLSDEALSYPVKKSLYEYIRNDNFYWCLNPENANSKFQKIVDLPRSTFGKIVMHDCDVITLNKYRAVILETRNNTGSTEKRAFIFGLTGDFTGEKIDELRMDFVNPYLFRSGSRTFIIDGPDTAAKKYEIIKNDSNMPVFTEYKEPSLFDLFNEQMQMGDTTKPSYGPM